MTARLVVTDALRVPAQEPADPAVGFQATVDFAAGVIGLETPAVDIMAGRGLGVWRVSAIALAGATVLGRLIYGTSSSFQLNNIRLPLVAYVPGNCSLYLRPADAGPLPERLTIRVSAKLVGGFTTQVLRTFHDAGGGAVTMPSSGVGFTALTASTVTVEGVAVALAVNARLTVTAPAILTAGSGLLEHEL